MSQSGVPLPAEEGTENVDYSQQGERRPEKLLDLSFPTAKEAKSLEYGKCPRDFVVFPFSRHFMYSKNLVVYAVSRHIWTFWTDVVSGPHPQ